MRYIIMHKTNPHWESGAIPSKELIARVGALIGEMAKSRVFVAGEGLRASSEGVRLRFSGGARTITKGPFRGENELPAGFAILRTGSLDEAVEWATRQAATLGDVEMDIRPINEPWDVGICEAPSDLTKRRWMVLRKATAATESGESPSASQRATMSRLVDESTRSGVHVASESLRPSARGRRYKNSADGRRVIDGPFTETKELIAGYCIVNAESLEEACRWAEKYIDVVETDEVDVRELE
ncbi:MAG TPA: YciI family protein [Gemmatimonadales bacterium]|nr:YciI family protein [Gemmatimonadales bacterium]